MQRAQGFSAGRHINHQVSPSRAELCVLQMAYHALIRAILKLAWLFILMGLLAFNALETYINIGGWGCTQPHGFSAGRHINHHVSPSCVLQMVTLTLPHCHIMHCIIIYKAQRVHFCMSSEPSRSAEMIQGLAWCGGLSYRL